MLLPLLSLLLQLLPLPVLPLPLFLGDDPAISDERKKQGRNVSQNWFNMIDLGGGLNELKTHRCLGTNCRRQSSCTKHQQGYTTRDDNTQSRVTVTSNTRRRQILCRLYGIRFVARGKNFP